MIQNGDITLANCTFNDKKNQPYIDYKSTKALDIDVPRNLYMSIVISFMMHGQENFPEAKFKVENDGKMVCIRYKVCAKIIVPKIRFLDKA
jgi:hypothetical protein